MHTSWSDGSGSIEDMARAASERGYEYIAVTGRTALFEEASGVFGGRVVSPCDGLQFSSPLLSELQRNTA